MKEELLSVGYQIPGFSNLFSYYSSEKSISDADVILFSTETPDDPHNNYPSKYKGLDSFNDNVSARYLNYTKHWKKEIQDALIGGKTVFIFLVKKKSFFLGTGASEYKNAKTTIRLVEEHNNYEFLPYKIGQIINASGEQVEFTNNPIFSELTKSFIENMVYEAYLEELHPNNTIYTNKSKTRVLGSHFKIENGNLIILPYIKYDEKTFIKTRKYKSGNERSLWTPDACKFGYNLVNHLIQIHRNIQNNSNYTPPPLWALSPSYQTETEQKLLKEIELENKNIESSKLKIAEFENKIKEERKLSALLYEQGKPLENAVTKALTILGYHSELYDDGNLEFDHVIVSPEGHRYIGETEGKDTRDVDITKFRQLLDSLNADFARDEVNEKATGILFGNSQRLIEPKDRSLDFTKKCLIGAEREKII